MPVASMARSMVTTSGDVMVPMSRPMNDGRMKRSICDFTWRLYWSLRLPELLNQRQATVSKRRSTGTADGAASPLRTVIGSMPAARSAFARSRDARAAARVTTG